MIVTVLPNEAGETEEAEEADETDSSCAAVAARGADFPDFTASGFPAPGRARGSRPAGGASIRIRGLSETRRVEGGECCEQATRQERFY
jgi:hypothetical protein